MKLRFIKKVYSSSILMSLLVSVNDANLIDRLKQNLTSINDVEVQKSIAEADFENYKQAFNFTLDVDYNLTKDTTEQLSGLSQYDLKQKQGSVTFAKKFISGTLLSLKWLTSQTTNPASAPSLSSDYYQTYATLSIQQDLFPNFFGSQSLNDYEKNNLNLKSKNIEIKIQNINLIKDNIKLFWSAISLRQQIEDTKKIQIFYQDLSKKMDYRKSNALTNPGEYEQVKVEILNKSSALSYNEVQYNNTLLQFAKNLNTSPEKINLEIHKDSLPEKPVFRHSGLANKDLHLYYQLQKINTEKANSDYLSTQYNNYPNVKIYASYNQQGLDQNAQKSYNETFDTDRNKYTVGLKMSYQFDQNYNTQLSKAKLLKKQIEDSKSVSLNEQIDASIKNSEKQIDILWQQLTSQKEIIKLRNKIVSEVRSSYLKGRSDINDLISAHNNLIQAEVDYYKTLGDYSAQKYEYENIFD